MSKDNSNYIEKRVAQLLARTEQSTNTLPNRLIANDRNISFQVSHTRLKDNINNSGRQHRGSDCNALSYSELPRYPKSTSNIRPASARPASARPAANGSFPSVNQRPFSARVLSSSIFNKPLTARSWMTNANTEDNQDLCHRSPSISVGEKIRLIEIQMKRERSLSPTPRNRVKSPVTTKIAFENDELRIINTNIELIDNANVEGSERFKSPSSPPLDNIDKSLDATNVHSHELLPHSSAVSSARPLLHHSHTAPHVLSGNTTALGDNTSRSMIKKYNKKNKSQQELSLIHHKRTGCITTPEVILQTACKRLNNVLERQRHKMIIDDQFHQQQLYILHKDEIRTHELEKKRKIVQEQLFMIRVVHILKYLSHLTVPLNEDKSKENERRIEEEKYGIHYDNLDKNFVMLEGVENKEFSLKLYHFTVTMVHIIWKVKMMCRIWKKRYAVRVIKQSVGKFKKYLKFKHCAREFIQRIIKIQRYVRAFIAVRKSRLEVLTVMWRRIEYKYVRDILVEKRKLRSQDMEQQLSSCEFMQNNTKRYLEGQQKRWRIAETKMKTILESNLALERAEKKKVEKEEEYTDDNVIDSPVTDLIIREHMLPPAVFDQAVFDFLRENRQNHIREVELAWLKQQSGEEFTVQDAKLFIYGVYHQEERAARKTLNEIMPFNFFSSIKKSFIRETIRNIHKSRKTFDVKLKRGTSNSTNASNRTTIVHRSTKK